MKQKLRNYGLWAAVAGLIGMFIQDANLIAITPEKYDIYVKSILGIFTLAGIISNPKDGKWFRDKTK